MPFTDITRIVPETPDSSRMRLTDLRVRLRAPAATSGFVTARPPCASYGVDREIATAPFDTHVSPNLVHAVRPIHRCPRGSRGAERANLERATGAVARIQHLTDLTGGATRS
jgi:hypothetical protein